MIFFNHQEYEQVEPTMKLPERQERKRHNVRLPLPDIPREMWCDFRIDYEEKHMNLVQLAAKYYCDPRTVRSCLQRNKSSSDLGKKSTPTRIQHYENHIHTLLSSLTSAELKDVSSIYGLSHYLYPKLQEMGYTASERTLRNHLQKQPYIKALLEKQKTHRTGSNVPENGENHDTD